MNAIIVKNEKSGAIFTKGTKVSTDGKSYGFYVLNQTSVSMEGGFIKEDKRSAILTVENGLGERLNYAEGKVIAGQIVRAESSTPFHKGQEPVINPTTKAVVTRGGQPLYRQDLFTADMTAVDSLIAHDSAEVSTPAVSAKAGLAN